MILNIFDKNEVNTGRQVEIDLVKAICIIGMIIVHVFEEFGVHGANESLQFMDYALVVVGDALFGAVTFMFCMGTGLNYSKKFDAKNIIKRGLIILILAYLLNIVRCTSNIIGFLLMKDFPNKYDYIFRYIFNGDIYAFAGLSLILFGFLKLIKLSNLLIVLVSIILFIIASIGGMLDMKPYYFGFFVGLFLPVNVMFSKYEQSVIMCFPLFLWFFSVAFGNLFGYILKRCKNKNLFYGLILIISSCIVIPYSIINIPQKVGIFSGNLNLYYYFNFKDAFVCLCGAHMAVSTFYFLAKIIPNNIKTFMSWLSKNIMIAYIIQWILIENIAFNALYIDENINNNTFFMISITIIILILSIILTRVVEKILMRRKSEINIK